MELRGIRELQLTPQRESFVISGPNGSGKSGVVDAIQFGLTGEISRLSGKGTGGLSVQKHGPHVDRRDDPAAAEVSLTLHFPELGKTAVLTRNVKTHPPRRRHPAGARQRRAHRPPTPSRSAAADRHDVARHRPRRPRRFRAPPATRLRPVTPRRPSVGEDWQRRNAASTATDPGGSRYAPAQVSIKPTSPVAARDSAASQASSARVC